jgi:uncharacterized membrane protein
MKTGIFQGIASLVCHQSPDRTFSTVDGGPLPLCARCTGIYTGFAIGALSQMLTGRVRHRPTIRTILLSAILLGALLFEALGERWGFWAWSNEGRLFIGLLAGGALSAVLVPLCRYFLSRRPVVNAARRPADLGIFVALTGAALSARWFPWMLPVLAVISLAGLFAIYACMNLAMSGAALRLRQRNARRGWVLSLIGLVLLLFLCEGAFFSLI